MLSQRPPAHCLVVAARQLCVPRKGATQRDTETVPKNGTRMLNRTCWEQSSWEAAKAGSGASALGSFLRTSCSLGPRLRGALRCKGACPSLPEERPELAGLAAGHASQSV